jgi:hypothetical protein
MHVAGSFLKSLINIRLMNIDKYERCDTVMIQWGSIGTA